MRRPCRFGLEAPPSPGASTLVITLVQEGVRWFDEVDEENALGSRVQVI